jgi:hypothetical protein
MPRSVAIQVANGDSLVHHRSRITLLCPHP